MNDTLFKFGNLLAQAQPYTGRWLALVEIMSLFNSTSITPTLAKKQIEESETETFKVMIDAYEKSDIELCNYLIEKYEVYECFLYWMSTRNAF